MTRQRRTDQETAARMMADIEPAYTDQQAQVEADRCLYCFDAPCIMACPTGIDIPAFIKKIAVQNNRGAARTILSSNILGASCARVCPTTVLCEGACVLQDRDQKPIKIGRLQRYATDAVAGKEASLLEKPAAATGKKVAVIGGGPAGLGCAAELARLGHAVTIFERRPEAGGLNTYGIAYYKLTPEVSLDEVEVVKSLGVEIRCGVEVGVDLPMADLQKDYDAVFLGVGLGHTYTLGIPGEDLPEVMEALAFIEEIHTQPLHEVAVGEHVVVIGCGNTAIDAVTQAKRLGATSATIVYRRGEKDMPAYAYEYEIAKADGCGFVFHAAPVEVLGESSVTGLKVIRTEPDAEGRARPVPGSESVIPCDMVIKALGQEKQVKMLQTLLPDLALDAKGRVVRDEKTGQTSVPGVFAGGDAANGGREVVNAVAEGKKAARGIHAALCGDAVEGPVQHTRVGVPGGKPVGSGLDRPVRVPEAEAEYYAAKGAR
ncbi:MAG: NAD(P)-dependent oxidoreductase [Kiritimatiellae bacterium]|nr:NAD(P)-dependent oxidoreductase [Kiritimatiellia bacterium]